MIFVRILSLSVAILCFYLAYVERHDAMPMILGGSFFALMAYWSFRNKGAIDGPAIYFAVATGAFFYTIMGLLAGEYRSRRLKVNVSIDQNPERFWVTFGFFLLISIASLIYALYKHRKKNHGEPAARDDTGGA